MNPPLPRRYPRLVETVSEDGAPSSLEPPSAELETSRYLAGEVVGDRYRLVREIGRGGMGVVWVAHSLVLGVDVALKLIRASGASSGVASRMAREAHAAARLGHPALVRVFDFGWTRHADPYLVMELVQGETLAALLKRETRVPAIRAVQTLLPIADGLRLAHDKGIVHRDIKPDNVFVAADALGRRQPKLLDFGIAKVDKQIDGRLTQVGAVLGSPDYMSPEQALGLDDLDERTDIWSLCVVLYELITGAVPFQKSNYNALMHAIINEDPRPSTECGAGDKSLWDIVERGLRKQRQDRFQSVTELGEALALWLYEHGIKEDLSGNSIRAVWLDTGVLSSHAGSLSPVGRGRADVPSAPPRRAVTSNVPTERAPDPSRVETLLTRRPPAAAPGNRRLLTIGLPLLALLCSAAGAWLALSFRAPAKPAPVALATAPAKPLPAPTPVAAAPQAPAAPAATLPPLEAEALSAGPAEAVAPKPGAPNAAKPKRLNHRAKMHDFGF